jgi:hypothetical protein
VTSERGGGMYELFGGLLGGGVRRGNERGGLGGKW